MYGFVLVVGALVHSLLLLFAKVEVRTNAAAASTLAGPGKDNVEENMKQRLSEKLFHVAKTSEEFSKKEMMEISRILGLLPEGDKVVKEEEEGQGVKEEEESQGVKEEEDEGESVKEEQGQPIKEEEGQPMKEEESEESQPMKEEESQPVKEEDEAESVKDEQGQPIKEEDCEVVALVVQQDQHCNKRARRYY